MKKIPVRFGIGFSTVSVIADNCVINVERQWTEARSEGSIIPV